jgi:hypothetical protein
LLTKATEPALPAVPYTPTPQEAATLQALAERKSRRIKAPEVVLKPSGPHVSHMTLDHPDLPTGSNLLLAAIGSTDITFMDKLVRQICAATTNNVEHLNFILSVVKAVQPKDELEAMLATQMAVVHIATMTMAKQLASATLIPQQDSAQNALNKLLRTYTTQVEALKRYRTGGQQKVTVEHVHVHEGGQAIVGSVTHRGGKGGE